MAYRSLSSIKFRLALLVTVCVVPAALIAISLLSYDYYRERGQLISNAITTARTLAYSLDKEFSSIEATLRALGTSPTLTNDLPAFYQQTQDLRSHGLINNIVLTTTSGEQIINTLRPYSEKLPGIGDSTQLHLLADTNGPIISRLFTEQMNKRSMVTVSIPVERDGRHIYNLSAGIFPEQLAGLLHQQQLPPDWIVAVLDSSGNIVARSHEMNRFLGRHASPGLVNAMAFDNEGWTETKTSEGIAVLAAFSRSSVSNWTIAIGIPARSLTESLRTKLVSVASAIAALLASSLALASFIGSRIALSIRGLRAPALALGLGRPVEIPPLHLREADEVANALKQAAGMLKRAQHQAMHDPLTGLPNRALFNELVNKQIAVCQRSGSRFSILYIDLDGFKPVNDIHGHGMGDKLLCEVARRLQGGIREADMAARLGGDEFAVILVGTPGGSARNVASNLLDAISKPYNLDSLVVTISASIGAAGYPESGTEDHDLLRMADVAMYRAKEAGKGQVVCAAVLDGAT
jgi:diguanylate cyclase (GGDEF)-like protein